MEAVKKELPLLTASIVLFATFANYGCTNPQASSKQKSNDWVFVSASDPNAQYAVDVSTGVKEIGFVTYWKAKLLSSPSDKGSSVYLTKMRVICGVDSRALLQMLGFDSSGNKVEEFVGASDFILTSPADEAEKKINNAACSAQADGSISAQLKTLSSPPNQNPNIKKTIQSVLFANKHLANSN